MRALPAGTVTMMFTDIAGSTALVRELGEAYPEALAEHRRVLRAVFERHEGLEVDTQGDAFFVVFRRASDALAAARDAQTELRGPVRVRIGLHTGEPVLADEGYVGMDVHVAARIAAAGHGGQVLVSNTTRELVGRRGCVTSAAIGSRTSARYDCTSSATPSSPSSRASTVRTCPRPGNIWWGESPSAKRF